MKRACSANAPLVWHVREVLLCCCSASGVDVAVDVCLSNAHVCGNELIGPSIARCAPDVLLSVLGQPAKSASANNARYHFEGGSPTNPTALSFSLLLTYCVKRSSRLSEFAVHLWTNVARPETALKRSHRQALAPNIYVMILEQAVEANLPISTSSPSRHPCGSCDSSTKGVSTFLSLARSTLATAQYLSTAFPKKSAIS